MIVFWDIFCTVSGIPTNYFTTMFTFANDNALLSSQEDDVVASDNLQPSLLQVELLWMKKWRNSE